jgi:hypothetical protein
MGGGGDWKDHMKAIYTKSEFESPPPVITTERGSFRAGDAVLCRVRRCESLERAGSGCAPPPPPHVEEFEGVLESASLWQPFWWVRSGTGLKYVWNDEMERKQ